MRKKLQFPIEEATSMNNGIIFYSKRHKSHIAIATIDEDGIITTNWTTTRKYQKSRDKHEKIAEMKEIFILVVFSLPFAILFYILWNLNPIYGSQTFLIVNSLLLLGLFLVFTNRKGKQEKNLYKFHSAEHMVLNAYRKLERVPSLEEIRQYSRFSNSCGTNLTTHTIISYITMFACSFIPNALYMLIGVISGQVIICILTNHGFLNFLQKFTTAPPTDKELSVAIAGMNVWLENEKKEKEKSKFLKFLHQLFPRVFS